MIIREVADSGVKYNKIAEYISYQMDKRKMF